MTDRPASVTEREYRQTLQRHNEAMKALRAELAEARATLARVEALPAKFRDSTLSDGFGPLGAAGDRALDMCADALEAALLGERID